jgi:hypothetical protein
MIGMQKRTADSAKTSGARIGQANQQAAPN